MTKEDFQRLVERAKKGDEAALEQVRHAMDANPAIWARLGDLSAHAELSMIELVAGDNPVMVEALVRHLHAMKKELASPNASLLERLTAQRVVVCWLACQFGDMMCARMDQTRPDANHWSKRMGDSERRYLAAIRALKLVREMLPSPSLPAAVLGAQSGHAQPQAAACGSNGGRVPESDLASRAGRNGHAPGLSAVNKPPREMIAAVPAGSNGHRSDRPGSLAEPTVDVEEGDDLLTLTGFAGPANRIAAVAAASGELPTAMSASENFGNPGKLARCVSAAEPCGTAAP